VVRPLARQQRRGAFEAAGSTRQPGKAIASWERLLGTLQSQAGNRAVSGLLRDASWAPSRDVVQRAPMVTGDFTAPTPEDGAKLEARDVPPLTSPGFQATAEFHLVAPNTEYKHGEYRQLIKGAFRRGGKPQAHPLNDGLMSPDEWKEDATKAARYGYRFRGQGVWTNAQGNVDKANGSRYQAWDQPKALTDDDEMDLHFKGQLVDTGDGNRVITERTWHVYGKRAPKL